MRAVPPLSQQPSRLASAHLPCRPAAMQASRQPATSVAAAAAAPGSSGGVEPVAPQAQQPRVLRTCRRCKQQFDPAANGPTSCRYHSALWTGGEISKAIGFCRQSDAPEHQLRAVAGRTGLIQFWDCCGAEQEDAPGCCVGRHVTYDDPDD